MNRCGWVLKNHPLYEQYHDLEWGNEVHDDVKLFEMLVLESFQAGLSWICILNKRESFRDAFDHFDVSKVSCYDHLKVEQLMKNEGIVRNRLKILAAINNAKIWLQIQKEFGSFDSYIWSFTNHEIIYESCDLYTTSPLSDQISYDLKKRGMKFVGSTTIYSYLQAVGVINGHTINCDCYQGRN